MNLRERMATPARHLDAAHTTAELARLDGYTPHLVPAERLRFDALQLRLRELAGEPVVWPMLTDCGWCHGSGYDSDGRACMDCGGRGKVAIVLTDSAEIRRMPVAAAGS